MHYCNTPSLVDGESQRVDEFVVELMAIGLSIEIVKRIMKVGCRGCLVPPPGFFGSVRFC